MSGEGSRRPSVSSEPEWDVESIVDEKTTRRGVQYLVKWVGWPHESNTWEPLENLSGCPEVLQRWRERAAPPPTVAATELDGAAWVDQETVVVHEDETEPAAAAAAGSVSSSCTTTVS